MKTDFTTEPLLRSRDSFIYGLVPALEAEVFLNDRVVLLLNLRQRSCSARI